MKNHSLLLGLLAGASLSAICAAQAASLSDINTVVVIYAENRGFDNLYSGFPGARGLQNLPAGAATQLDRDGTPLKELPPAWGGLTIAGVTPAVTEAQTAHMPAAPFGVDDVKGLNTPVTSATRDLWHRFYQNQMQLDGGKSDKYVAWADSGGLVMGHYDGSTLPLWNVAKKYVLADNFFMGSFGGSFLNHFYLVCSCAPVYPDAATAPAKPSIAAVEADGVTLKVADNSPKSALDGGPKFVSDGNITPDFFAVNTMQPPYQPSANKAPAGNPLLADPMAANTLPPQTMQTIGDTLTAKGVAWAWYAGAWQAALDGHNTTPIPNFQYHHQPFNYFVNYAPGTPARAEHLKDGGLGGVNFIRDIDAGKLPAVTFYKPQGNLNEHAGYTDIESGDEHMAEVIDHLEKSPQWGHMLVIVTYDENGGWWDHIAPPKGDRFGPGSRIPAIIASPFAKKGTVDQSFYDTTSVIRFLTKRFDLAKLPGVVARDAALAAAGSPPLGDLTGALDLTP